METEKLAQDLLKIEAPIKVVFTLDKARSAITSLKDRTSDQNQSNIVYRYTYGLCKEEYIGYTERLGLERFKEHDKNGSTEVLDHLKECGTNLDDGSFKILYTSNRGAEYLMTAEAILIKDNKPGLNKRNEFQTRQLRLKLF